MLLRHGQELMLHTTNVHAVLNCLPNHLLSMYDVHRYIMNICSEMRSIFLWSLATLRHHRSILQSFLIRTTCRKNHVWTWQNEITNSCSCISVVQTKEKTWMKGWYSTPVRSWLTYSEYITSNLRRQEIYHLKSKGCFIYAVQFNMLF